MCGKVQEAISCSYSSEYKSRKRKTVTNRAKRITKCEWTLAASARNKSAWQCPVWRWWHHTVCHNQSLPKHLQRCRTASVCRSNCVPDPCAPSQYCHSIHFQSSQMCSHLALESSTIANVLFSYLGKSYLLYGSEGSWLRYSPLELSRRILWAKHNTSAAREWCWRHDITVLCSRWWKANYRCLPFA